MGVLYRPFHDHNGYHLKVSAPFSVSDGYAVAAEHTISALLAKHVDVSVHNCWFSCPDGLTPATIDLLRNPSPFRYQIGIALSLPRYFHEIDTELRIGWTMWETTDPLELFHPDWPEQLSKVDFLWVPTQWQATVFESCFQGVIHVVPLAVNPIYRPIFRPLRDTFTVGLWGTLTSRKCPLESIEVFQRAFPRDQYPHCRLQIKTKMGVIGGYSAENGRYEDHLDAIPVIDDDRITVFNEIWYPDRMLQFMGELDCALLLSHGEGFGLCGREAMATGLATILSDHTGYVEVCDSQYNWPVPTLGTEKSPMGGDWFVSDYDAAVEHLRWIHDHRYESILTGLKAAEWFDNNWGGEAVAQTVISSVESIL